MISLRGSVLQCVWLACRGFLEVGVPGHTRGSLFTCGHCSGTRGRRMSPRHGRTPVTISCGGQEEVTHSGLTRWDELACMLWAGSPGWARPLVERLVWWPASCCTSGLDLSFTRAVQNNAQPHPEDHPKGKQVDRQRAAVVGDHLGRRHPTALLSWQRAHHSRPLAHASLWRSSLPSHRPGSQSKVPMALVTHERAVPRCMRDRPTSASCMAARQDGRQLLSFHWQYCMRMHPCTHRSVQLCAAGWLAVHMHRQQQTTAGCALALAVPVPVSRTCTQRHARRQRSTRCCPSGRGARCDRYRRSTHAQPAPHASTQQSFPHSHCCS